MDGDDTNDGRAEDASRACRTIGGAVNSPYYQPGTQILVSAGFYLEDNPIRMKPYTSIRGSDIRTCFIEPINKTQDLFHVESGCYINYVTFLNGRSGLLEGEYAEGFNRGAYATAFPPQSGANRIDLYHSPYIQNCTNQSGPWLKDGTMFVPNQTIQVPLAVGVGTWPANTTTIVVDTGQGVISQGMSINAGQQNQGFFNARTLLLANKPFLQEQVVAYVDQTFNTGTFIYDTVKCARDTGLIVDSITIDMLQNSESESIFAGLQYWRQSGYVDAIGDQLTTTTAAISFVKALAISTATDAASATQGTIVSDRFDDILTVVNTSTATLVTGEFSQWVTDSIISNGTATTDVLVVAAYDALISAKESIQDQTIDYINSTLAPYSYDSVKCARDTGLIVDSIAQDILFNGNSQSTFAGLQYWNQSGYVSGIASEITTTTNAITYVRDLAAKIVVNDVTGTRYQTTATQNIMLPAGTAAEATDVTTDFDVILDILTLGTVGVTDIIVPNGIEPSTATSVVRAYNLLQANRAYIQAEAVAFVESTKTPGFVYDQDKCYRDVGYMLDSVSFDLLYTGNKQAVQSGVYYYGFDASSSAIEGQSPQTVAAYTYIKSLMTKVIRGIEIPTSELYQTSVTQTTGAGGTMAEVLDAESKIDIITNIIQNGPGVAAAPSPISLYPRTEQEILDTAILLNDNREFIKAEVVAYVNSLNDFFYDEAKCRRDVGYMVDSVAFDLLHGGNKQAIKSGVYYFGYTGDTTEIPNEVPQTTAAYNFIKSLLPSIVKAEEIENVYQTGTVQVTTLTPGTDYEAGIIQNKIDVITNIIRNGPSIVDARIPINLNGDLSSGVSNAYEIVAANKEFIKAEVLAYLDTFGTFDYSREFCYRDVGILVENISYDAAFGGNEKAVESGLAYYDGVVSKIAGQEVQTVAAIDYLNLLSQQVITNTTCTDLLSNGFTTTATSVQVRNTVLVGGEIASPAISSLFNTISTIINNGPTAAPAVYKGNNVDAAYISSEILMQANRAFIQQDTINYINNLVLDFPYSEIKCRRDTGLIIDSIAFDLLYPTTGFSQSTFAGLQYWNKESYVGDVEVQLDPTLRAIEYLKELSVKVVQNITPTDDLVVRYQNSFTQVTNLESATAAEAAVLTTNFGYIEEIVGGVTTGWSDRIIPNGTPSAITSVYNAVDLINANRQYIQHEVTAYVDATSPGFVYDADKCRRDVSYMLDAVTFDLVHSGNRQSVQNGLYYFGINTGTTTIQNQEIQTTAAFDYLSTILQDVVRNIEVPAKQNRVGQLRSLPAATLADATVLDTAISTITNIIINGPGSYVPTGIASTASTGTTALNAFDIIYANKDFLIEEVIAHIDQTYNPNNFNYNEAKCYRDVGLIVDAVSQDILLGGNQRSVEAGLSYWTFGENSITGQETTTTMALNHARDIALEIIANRPVEVQTGTVIQQVINPFFQYGEDYMPQEAVKRNFGIITNIINRGPQFAPPVYAGGGLFALTGINGSDVLNSPQVVSVSTLSEGRYLVGLNTATIGFGVNSTLYFGDTQTFPLRNFQVDELSYALTGNTSTWSGRKLDPIGSMGGSLVDGAVISTRSPIQSFVYDAYTQINQGGRGVHIINDGYAQLVSVFTVFCSTGVEVGNGGIASIVNSNANFGNLCLVAKGYGKRKFSGTIYNPPFKAYPDDPEFNIYYPSGFWPNDARVRVQVPDQADRPSISLVMEVVPPEGYENEQAFPGFLNASPTTSTLTTGTIALENIDTTGIAIGNSVFIRDQFGKTTSTNIDSMGNWIPYCPPDTVVSNIEYNKIILSKALTSGGGEVDNPNFFDFYFCGNAYYTVLGSEVGDNPIPVGTNFLSTASTGGTVSQVPAHLDAMAYLNTLTNQIINNTAVAFLQTGTTQTVLPLVRSGGDAQTFIDLRFGEIISIIGAANLAAAEAVIKPAQRTKEGPLVQGGGAAITLIQANIEFLADEVDAYVQANYPSLVYNKAKCQRDVKLTLQRLIYDIETGGRYNSVYIGLSYWQRNGTHHLVQLGENVTRTDLFPDGATTNFYQRSYMSASGYVFEYVGAGIDYGSLPQRGLADPNQLKEVVQLDSGKVFFTSTDQNGDFRIGPGLVISQATGVLSGRTFTKSLFANMTPFILAIES
jgi:chaperone required for assembly of F1-ATPase